MSDKPEDAGPPIPRDASEASFSEMVPIKSSKIKIHKSPLFIFLILTAVVTIFSFNLMGGMGGEGVTAQQRMGMFSSFAFLIAAYLLAVVLLGLFLYSKTDKPLWANGLNFAFVCLLLLTPISLPYFLVFREILPGNFNPKMNMVQTFVSMFFGAGLMEELMKVTLVGLGAYMTVNAAKWAKTIPEGLFNALRIRGPLDGLMMGLFGGAGFILIETWTQYVPNTVMEVTKASGNEAGGFAMGLMLLFPRVIGGMVGHMAWAGITGYFIGLSVLRPSMWWKLCLGGWVASSVLHAVWNTQGHMPILGWLSALASGGLVLACLLKARQMEQSAGRESDSFGSIVVEKPIAPAAAPKPQAKPAAAPDAPAPKAAPAAKAIALALGDTHIAILPGGTIDLGAEPALQGRGVGVTGEITRHPTRADVLGLKNTGSTAWQVTLRDGSSSVIEPERNLRLAPGVAIHFADELDAKVIEV